MSVGSKLGVVLFQLGGPDSLESVEPFLFNLFSDPDILPIPLVGGLLRKPLARRIARSRAPHVAEHYRAIGRRSPIGILTARQAAALDAALRPEFDPLVVMAMRYWHPSTEEAVAAIRAASLDQLVLLPLYPHFSYATTLSSLKEWNRCYANSNSHGLSSSLPVRTVGDFHRHPLYIEALVDRINSTFRHFDQSGEVHIVFSAHGIPLSLVEKGDPYPGHIKSTVEAVLERGAWRNPHVLCFQSRVGPMKWLEPSTTATLERLGRQGVKRVLIVPLAFVTEHVETLHEINIEARELAAHAGIAQFRMMPAVGTHPRFIACLADLVRTTLGKEPSAASS
ncbi:MAG TPA: ferrochelatase [Candidatus Acidoferrales bacterium]|nr:ferrochelatase [Candidatus Acidoferrales bacterium]